MGRGAETVSQATQVLVEAAKQEKPNKGFLKITGEGLVKAAENLAKVTPIVLPIASQIVDHVLKLAG